MDTAGFFIYINFIYAIRQKGELIMNIIIGRVTKDLEPKTSQSGVNYVSFDVAENIGFGEKAKTIFHRCTIFGEELVNRIVNAKVKKGSLLQVVGEQSLDAYVRDGDGKAVPTSNIDVLHWGYVPASSGKQESSNAAPSDSGYSNIPSEDCDDGLPE